MGKANLRSEARPGRFTGRGGLKRLAEALQNQYVIGGDIKIATKIARKARVQSFQIGATLMQQGGGDTHLLFILSGTVTIEVNGHEIATRTANSHVGEMSLLDPLSTRSGTVRASEDIVTARIAELDFSRIAERHPMLWRRVALSLAERLRERAKFHRPPNLQPAVFIGSSSEGLKLAQCIYASLKRSELVPRLWSNGVFELSKTAIEDLTRETGESDFAILVLTKDDITRSRQTTKPSPRDNVIFELGLFMGALTRTRTYVFAPSRVDLKIPTDLLGVTFLRYPRGGGTLARRLRNPLKVVRAQIRRYGPRQQLGAL